MALIKCPECQREISDQADSCPNCGYKIKTKKSIVKSIKSKKNILLIVIILLIIGGVATGVIVNNRVVQQKAVQAKIAAEKKAEEERIAAEKKAEEERIAAEKLTPAEEQAVNAIKALKKVLKNPESLQVHSVFAYNWISKANNIDYSIKLECSAQNGFGGMNRKTYYIDVDKNGNVDLTQFDDTLQAVSAVGWVNSSNKELKVERLKKYIN